MKEYIERETVLKLLDEQFNKTDPNGEEQIGFLKCRSIIRKAPATDVVSRSVLEQIKWERDEAFSTLERHGLSLGSNADVVKVRHSYWQCSNVRMSSRDITCRYCHRTETISNGKEDFEYCPHCGAKMDGKDGEKNNVT